MTDVNCRAAGKAEKVIFEVTFKTLKVGCYWLGLGLIEAVTKKFWRSWKSLKRLQLPTIWDRGQLVAVATIWLWTHDIWEVGNIRFTLKSGLGDNIYSHKPPIIGVIASNCFTNYPSNGHTKRWLHYFLKLTDRNRDAGCQRKWAPDFQPIAFTLL